jgi:glucokinase
MERSEVRNDLLALLAQLTGIVNRLAKQSDGSIRGIGMGVAGLVDVRRQLILDSPNCPALTGVQLGAALGDATGYTVRIDNDANVMALGEGAFGAAQGSQHFICITLGTGVGGAVMCHGRLVSGWSGGGGELGHVPISRGGPRCGCGARGCLEAYVGRAGIDRYIAQNCPQLCKLGLREIDALARSGDGDAAAVFAYIGRTLAIGLAGMVNVFNPQLIVVGGGVAGAGELLFKPLETELKRRAFKVYLDGLEIRPAVLGNWAGVVGAAQLVSS